MLNWLKDKTVVQIRKDYQDGKISKREAVKKLVPIIAAKDNKVVSPPLIRLWVSL
jgi:hypothetical protein